MCAYVCACVCVYACVCACGSPRACTQVDVEGHEAVLLSAGASALHPRSMPRLHDVAWEIKPGNGLAVCEALAPFAFTHTLPLQVKPAGCAN